MCIPSFVQFYDKRLHFEVNRSVNHLLRRRLRNKSQVAAWCTNERWLNTYRCGKVNNQYDVVNRTTQARAHIIVTACVAYWTSRCFTSRLLELFVASIEPLACCVLKWLRWYLRAGVKRSRLGQSSPSTARGLSGILHTDSDMCVQLCLSFFSVINFHEFLHLNYSWWQRVQCTYRIDKQSPRKKA